MTGIPIQKQDLEGRGVQSPLDGWKHLQALTTGELTEHRRPPKCQAGHLFAFILNFHSPDIRGGSWLQYGRCGRTNFPIFYSNFLFINIYVFLFFRLPAGISEYPRAWLLLE